MRTIGLLIFFLWATTAFGQGISGTWEGVLQVQGVSLELYFTVTESDGEVTATLDVPKQGAKDVPMGEVSFEGNTLRIAHPPAGVVYEGEWDGADVVVGTFSQGAMQQDLNLDRQADGVVMLKRPQNPQAPFPYQVEEVTFENEAAEVTLAGTLTLPLDVENPPVVVLVSGSGPQNRDEELMGHKPFWVLADHFSRQGIAVLRYDDRGVAASTGDFAAATSADFATDAAAAVQYLAARDDVDASNIGIVGHSEGGLIAPIVAADYDEVAFIVMMAGPGLAGDELLLLQQRLIASANGMSDDIIKASQGVNRKLFEMMKSDRSLEQIEDELVGVIEEMLEENSDNPVFQEASAEEEATNVMNTFGNVWFRYFLAYDPAPTLAQVTCPVLSIFGDKDLQVPATVNIEAIEAALAKGGNNQVTSIIFPNLNHLFQESNTGSPNEYAEIEETFSPKAMEAMSDWILEQAGRD